MRRSSATLVLAVFLAGTIAADVALARSGGRGGHGRGSHHASGSITTFHRSQPRAAVVVPAPIVYGGYRASPYARYPYYGMGPYYVPGPYYETPGPAYLPYPPSEYIEQDHVAPAPQAGPAPQAEPAPAEPSAAAYWWFCPGANNYYPYVKTCPSGWQQVKPQ